MQAFLLPRYSLPDVSVRFCLHSASRSCFLFLAFPQLLCSLLNFSTAFPALLYTLLMLLIGSYCWSHSNANTGFLTAQRWQALPSSSRFSLLIDSYVANMVSCTLRLRCGMSSQKQSPGPSDSFAGFTVVINAAPPLPLRSGKSRIHPPLFSFILFLFCDCSLQADHFHFE